MAIADARMSTIETVFDDGASKCNDCPVECFRRSAPAEYNPSLRSLPLRPIR